MKKASLSNFRLQSREPPSWNKLGASSRSAFWEAENAKPQAPDLGREGGGTCAAECVNIFPFFKMRLYANFFQLNLL